MVSESFAEPKPTKSTTFEFVEPDTAVVTFANATFPLLALKQLAVY